MNVFQYPLPRLCLAVIAGIALYPVVKPEFWIVLALMAASVTVLTLLFLLKRDKTIAFFGLVIISGSLSGTTACAIKDVSLQENHFTRFINASNKATAVIRERLRPSASGERYYATVESIDGKPCVGKVLIYTKGDSVKLKTGDRIAFAGAIKKISLPRNPGQFNYANYLANKGVFASVSLSDKNFALFGSPKKDIFYYADAFRNRIKTRLQQSGLGRDELAVLNALILGQQQEISKEILQDYQFAGAVHILSVSGLHVGFLVVFLRFLFGLFPRNRFSDMFALLGTLAILWLFAVVAGLSASVLRSVAMFSFLTVSIYAAREYSAFHSLFVSMLLILWIDPSFLYDAGFQLSYLALAGILWLHPILMKLWEPKLWLMRNIRDLVSVSIAAQLATLPLSLFYFHQFPGLFLITNLVVVPAVGLIMAIGSIAVIWAVIANVPEFVVWLTQMGISLLNGLIKWIASFESFRFTQLFFSSPMLVFSYVALAFLIWHWQKRSRAKLTIALVALICFQGLLLNSLQSDTTSNEFIVFHKARQSVWAVRSRYVASFSGKADAYENVASDFKAMHPRLEIRKSPDAHGFIINDKRFFIIDSSGRYPKQLKPDILLITGSPKLNFDRVLSELNPKQVIADGGNFPSLVDRLSESCKKAKIPFHATAETGSYSFTY